MIYIVSQFYPPLSNAPANRMGHLVCALIERFGKDKIRVITGRPNYPHGILQEEFKGRLYKKKVGLYGEHVWHLYEYPAPYRGKRKKTLGYLSFALSVLCYFLFKRIKKEDVVFVTSPPVFYAYAIWFLSKLKRNMRYMLDVRDLWPDGVVGMGLIKADSMAYCVTDGLSNRAYRDATVLIGNSNGICHFLRKKFPEKEVPLIYNPVDTFFFQPQPQPQPQPHTRNKKTKILFSGTFAYSVNLLVFMQAIKQLTGERNDFQVVLIGEGEEKPLVEQFIEEHTLNEQVTVLPYTADRTEMVKTICEADICFASLKNTRTLKYAVPSKILEYLACGKTVIAAIEGPFSEALSKEGAAHIIPPGDKEALCAGLNTLLDNPTKTFKGRVFIETYFSLQTFNEKIQRLFTQMNL